MISPSLLNPVMVNIAKTLPVTADPCGRTIYPLVADQDENLYVAKMDWQISDKSSFFGRFMLGNLNTGSTYDGKNPLSINPTATTTTITGSLSEIPIIFSANLVSSIRLGANRTNVQKIPDNYESWAGFGANVYSSGREYDRDHGDRRIQYRQRICICRGAAQRTHAHLAEDLSLDQGKSSDPVRRRHLSAAAELFLRPRCQR